MSSSSENSIVEHERGKKALPRQTVDDVVATNIRRLRGETTRKRLAERLGELTGRSWSASQIVRLEGAQPKKGTRKPQSAKWVELVDLALVFDVTIFGLVLPQEAKSAVEIVNSELPLPIRDADETTAGWPFAYITTADEFAGVLFRLRLENLTAKRLEQAADDIGYWPPESLRIDSSRKALGDALAGVALLLHIPGISLETLDPESIDWEKTDQALQGARRLIDNGPEWSDDEIEKLRSIFQWLVEHSTTPPTAKKGTI